MKTLGVLTISLLYSVSLQSQYRAQLDPQFPSILNIAPRGQSFEMGLRAHPDPGVALDILSRGDTVFNTYGDLKNDKPEFNAKYPWWTVVLKVTGANVFTFAIDRYLFNYEFSRVGFNSWKHNIKTGWEWDQDRFGMNFIVHPYSGSAFFNAARSSGYNYWESSPFAALGSMEWEYFGENTLPSYNDIVNTTIDGIFLGEVTYRIGSDILDDQSTGVERFGREFSVFLLSPTRAFSRFTQGKMFRVTSEDVYQTEPLNVTLSTGYREVNDGSSFLSGPTNFMFNIHLDYGNPFEVRSRKPFDIFKLGLGLSKVSGRKILDNITGYGLLFGRNISAGNPDLLIGGFQHFDYFDNKTFELGTFGFGPGIMSKQPMGAKANLYTNFHLAVVPLAGNSTRYGPDTSQVRDYNFGGGAEAKLESTLNIGSWGNFTLIGYYFWIHTYVGDAGDHFIGLLEPRIAITVFDNISIGVEHLVYYGDRYTKHYGNFHQVRTEQRVFLSMYLESFKQQKE